MVSAIEIRPEEKLESEVALLRSRAEAIQVNTQEDYVNVCEIIVQGKGFVKRWKNVFAESIRSAKEHLLNIQNEEKKHVVAAEAVIAVAERKRNEYTERERRRAEEESRRENEERRIAAEKQAAEERKERERQAEIDRKNREREIVEAQKAGDLKKREAEKMRKEAAEAEAREKARAALEAAEAVKNVQSVMVKAAIPTVAGVKNQVFYFAEVVNPQLLIDRFINGDPSERDFLRRFIAVNEQEVGKYAREAKDNKKTETALPGVRAWSKG